MTHDPTVEPDPAIALLSTWGLRSGRMLRGWTVVAVRRDGARGVVAKFGRDSLEVDVRFRRASQESRFARVGEIDVEHSTVASSAARDVGELLRSLERWLTHQPVADLVPLFDREPTPVPPRSIVLGPQTVAVNHAYAGETPPLDPERRAPFDRPFMRFETIDVTQLHEYSDSLREMYAGRFGGLVIRNVYDRATMERVVAKLATEETSYPRTSFPARFNAHFYGRCLDGSDPALSEYLRDAERFRAETLSVFEGAAPFEDRMESIFRALGGGRKVELPRFTDGRPYTPATIRILLEDGQIGTHCGNEASTRPAYTHLNTLIDRGDQLSYFLTLQSAVEGGELIVYSLKWSDIDESRIVDGRTEVDDLLRTAQWMAISPGAGDLLIFDGGRYFHRVDVVRGGRHRWTIGGFMMFDAGGNVIHYWS